MYLQTTTDTSGYMILGYALAFIVMGVYVFSLYLRGSNVRRDIETLESLQNEAKPKGKPAAKA